MPHAIIRGKNGRRHEVDFGDAPIRVEIYASDETVEIFVEADFETHAEERRRFAILNVPRNLFSEASGAAARAGHAIATRRRLPREGNVTFEQLMRRASDLDVRTVTLEVVTSLRCLLPMTVRIVTVITVMRSAVLSCSHETFCVDGEVGSLSSQLFAPAAR